jgi:hypothetical protein
MEVPNDGLPLCAQASPTGYGSNPLSLAAPKEEEPLLRDNPGTMRL